MSDAYVNIDALVAMNFQAYIARIKENKDEWNRHKHLLTSVQNRLYLVQRHFAYISRDIIHDVVEQIGESNELKRLATVRGPWGNVAIKQRTFLDGFRPQYGNTVLKTTRAGSHFNKNRWRRFLRKAPQLHGKLELSGLCGRSLGSGEEFYSALKPHFHDLSMKYHIENYRYKDENLRAFLVKQLQSPCLRKLSLCVNADLGLDRELFKFCVSERFEYLNWDCRLPMQFFVRIYEALRTQKSATVCKNRLVKGFFDRSALKELVDGLQLKRSTIYHDSEWKTEYKRDDFANYVDYRVSISAVPECWYEHQTERVDVTIELKHTEYSYSAEMSNADDYDADDSFEDDAYHEGYWDNEDEYATCREIEDHLNEDDWTPEDCEDCPGCELCERSEYKHCDRCGHEHDCDPHRYK